MITLRVKNARQVQRALEDLPRKVVIQIKKVVEDYGGPLIVEKARAFLDSKITGDNTGLLSQSMWYDTEMEVTGEGSATYRIGWQRAYGPVLEWGPYSAREWTIKPKRFKHLSFYWPKVGHVVKMKQVVHRWDESQLRTHYIPALDAVWPRVMRRIQRGIRRAWRQR